MPEFVLNRNYTHRSVHGHIINFHKGQPVYVPPILTKEVAHLGAELLDGTRPQLLDDEAPAAPSTPVGSDREALILAAYEQLEGRNRRGDFTAQGRPHPKAVQELVGFEVDARERDAVWETFLAIKAERAAQE